jgi:choline-sulfatase
LVEHKRPSLLYIHSDQHNPYVTGCYGDPLIQTPNLDRLAQNGAVFENAYCCSPICVPSRMSMLTGQHPHQNRVWTNQHSLDSSIPTFAHAMGAAGYWPVLVGRMHALGPDQLHGYAERLVGDHQSNYIGGTGVDRGVLNGTAGPQRISLERSGPGQNAYQVHDEYVTASTIDYLNRLGIKKRAGLEAEPFCITAGYMLPHPPYVARRAAYDVYRDQMTLPEIEEPFSSVTHPHLRWWREHTGIVEATEEEVLRARAAYWGMVHDMDVMIGQIMAAVHENDLADNLLVVYSSDHGDMLGEHSLWWKHTFYEESAKVPLIVSWPGVIPAGQRSQRVVSALDVTATMIDALRVPALPACQGRSFLGLLTGDDAGWEDVAFSEYCSDEFAPEGGCYQRMIRQDEWKLVYYHGQPSQLFNLDEDPHERIDLASSPACQTIHRELERRVLDGWDADEIAAQMAVKTAEIEVLRDWARNTHPADQYRWALKPEMAHLDDLLGRGAR